MYIVFTKDIVLDMYNMYKEHNASVINIGKMYEITGRDVYALFHKNELKLKNNREKSIKYHCNEHYFDIIDTPEKSYWLGYIYADGYITSNLRYFGMSLSSQDEYILEQLKADLNSDYPIKHYQVTNGYKIGNDYSRLIICNPTLVSGLRNNGVVEHKTNILMPPTNITPELSSHFIRGIFDGDGCVSIYSNNILSVEFLSTPQVMTYIENILLDNNIISRRYPFQKRKPHQSVVRMRYANKNSILRTFHFLYDNATRKLDRKYQKFLKYFKSHNIQY